MVGSGLDMRSQFDVLGSDLFSIKSCQVALILFKASICKPHKSKKKWVKELENKFKSAFAFFHNHQKTALCVKDYQILDEKCMFLKVSRSLYCNNNNTAIRKMHFFRIFSLHLNTTNFYFVFTQSIGESKYWIKIA